MATASGEPSLSVIVPAKNEAHHIGRVVHQFTGVPCSEGLEVIVADDGSTDGTAACAAESGARVVAVENPMHTIARVRNEGARAARGRVLVFCDADTELSDVRALYRSVRQYFRDGRTVGAMPRIEVFPAEQQLNDRIFHSLYNFVIRMSFWTTAPFGSGQCQIVRRESFFSVGGYNERQVHGEDSKLFAELRNLGAIRFLTALSVYESPRRYRKVGYVRLVVTALLSLLGQAVTGKNMLSQWSRVD
jgi:glycosyltransferase involved in cell wall biosynthesis